MLIFKSTGDIIKAQYDALAIKIEGIINAEPNFLRNFVYLKQLDLSGNAALTDRYLHDLGFPAGLEWIDLSGCASITDESAVALSVVDNLRFIDLRLCNLITNKSMKYVAHLPGLEYLNLNWCYDIDDQGLQELSSCRTLEFLSLWSLEKVSDRGVASIVQLPNLRVLELPEFSGITDESMRLIGLYCTKLEYLRLANIDVTDVGLNDLARVNTLRRLVISELPKITSGAIKMLTERLPDLVVEVK